MAHGISHRRFHCLGLGLALAALIATPTIGLPAASAAPVSLDLAISSMSASLIKSNGRSAGSPPYTDNQISKIVIKFQVAATKNASVDVGGINFNLMVSNPTFLLGSPIFFSPKDASCAKTSRGGTTLSRAKNAVLNCTYSIPFQSFYLDNDVISLSLGATGCSAGNQACNANTTGDYVATAKRNVPLLGFSFTKTALKASATAVNYQFSFAYTGRQRSVTLNDPMLQSVWGSTWQNNLTCNLKSSSTSVAFDSTGKLPLTAGDVVTCVTNQSIAVTNSKVQQSTGWKSGKNRNSCTLTNTATAQVDVTGTNKADVTKWPGQGVQQRTTKAMTYSSASCKRTSTR